VYGNDAGIAQNENGQRFLINKGDVQTFDISSDPNNPSDKMRQVVLVKGGGKDGADAIYGAEIPKNQADRNNAKSRIHSHLI
jgi:hypothetical protein